MQYSKHITPYRRQTGQVYKVLLCNIPNTLPPTAGRQARFTKYYFAIFQTHYPLPQADRPGLQSITLQYSKHITPYRRQTGQVYKVLLCNIPNTLPPTAGRQARFTKYYFAIFQTHYPLPQADRPGLQSITLQYSKHITPYRRQTGQVYKVLLCNIPNTLPPTAGRQARFTKYYFAIFQTHYPLPQADRPGLQSITLQYSKHITPYRRQTGQETKDEVSGKDFKRDLDDKERSSKRHRVDAKRRVAPEHLPRDTLDQDEPFDSSSGSFPNNSQFQIIGPYKLPRTLYLLETLEPL